VKVLHPRSIYKYALNPLPNIYSEDLPRGSEWLSIAIDARGQLVIYALVASPNEYGPDEPEEQLQYEVVFTGDAVEYQTSDLIGTIAVPGTSLVIHVFGR
jgi:hypothetical protein